VHPDSRGVAEQAYSLYLPDRATIDRARARSVAITAPPVDVAAY
jgi:hypothetical protein